MLGPLAVAFALALWDLDRNGTLDLRDVAFAAALIAACGAAGTRIVRWARQVRTATRHAIVTAVKDELSASEQRVRTEVAALRTDVTTRMDGFEAKLAGHLTTEESGNVDIRDELRAIRALAEQAAGRHQNG